jgi:hypothetical protein
MSILMSACSKKTDVASNCPQTTTASLGYTCSFTEVDQFVLSVDPTQDFSATSGQETSLLMNNTCVGISNGMHTNDGALTISRSGNQIIIDSGADGIQFAGSQATVPQTDLQDCTCGIQGTGVLQSVEFDGVGNQILVTTSWSLVNNACAQTPAASGQSTPGSLTSSSYAVPSSITSATTYLYMEEDPGDYYGQTPFQQYNYTSSNATITPISQNGETGFTIHPSDGSHSWSIGFWPPVGSSLVPGDYSNIVWFDGVSATAAGFMLEGPYVQWAPASGSSFQVLSSSFDLSGNVQSFAASFTIVEYPGQIMRGVVGYNVP